MKSKSFLLATLMAVALPLQTVAQDVTLPALHVSGKQLVDDNGKAITLHGVMDTPNPFFNNYRWGYQCNRNTINSCLDYFDKIFTAITDHEQGSYCNIVRLCFDACWVNNPNAPADASDLEKYDATRMKNYLNWLFVPLLKKAVEHGLYAVVRPPVGQGNISLGDDYQQFLIDNWEIVASNEDIQALAGQVQFELANEPVLLKDKFGNSNANKLADYFQPVIDKIRECGFTGIIWAPGLGYQSDYRPYMVKSLMDNNLGYAVHVYNGWYNQTDPNADGESFVANFLNQVPVVETAPILISEVDWSPEKGDGTGHYNEWNEWVPANYGTWATATTSNWGMAYKYMIDHFGNISMTLQGTAVYLDIDAYLADGTVKPAFDGNWECCAAPCFQWYKEYWEEQNTTGVSEKVKVNSEEFAAARIYDLQGRKVSAPRKGLYIRNGKKVIIK